MDPRSAYHQAMIQTLMGPSAQGLPPQPQDQFKPTYNPSTQDPKAQLQTNGMITPLSNYQVGMTNARNPKA
jgi:hypothetical protein